MRILQILTLTIVVSIIFISASHARVQKGLDMSSPSVKLLKELNNDGMKIKNNDFDIEKVDVKADTKRVKELKEKFYSDKEKAFPAKAPKRCR